MFGWVDFKEDRKENSKNCFYGCLVREMRQGKTSEA